MIKGNAQNRHSWLLYSLLTALVLTPMIVKLAYYPAYPGSDDAFIHLTVARNFSDGQGWGINSGEPVNLSTSPLFTLFLTLSTICGLDALAVGKAFSLLFSTLGLLLLYLVLSNVTKSTVLRLSGLVLGAFDVHLWRWNGVVMETSMALLFVYLVFYLYYRQRKTSSGWGLYFVLGLTIGLASLVRFELAILLGCVLVDLFFNTKENRARQAAIICAGVLVAVVPWYAFSHLYFGSLLPTTFYAKTSDLQWINVKIVRQIGAVVLSAYGLPLGAAMVLVVCAFRRGIGRDIFRSFRLYLAIILFPVLLCAFYYLKTEGLQSPSRYTIPALAAIPIICVIVAEVSRERMNLPNLRAATLLIVGISASLALSLNQIVVAPTLRSFEDNYWATMKNATSFLAKHTSSTDVVLVEVDIGVLSYSSNGQFEIADGGGLASPELQGLSVSQQIAASHPKYVVESQGQVRGSLAKRTPQLKLVHYRQYKSHGTQNPHEQYFCNIYSLESASQE